MAQSHFRQAEDRICADKIRTLRGKRRYDRESRVHQPLRQGGERRTPFQLQCADCRWRHNGKWDADSARRTKWRRRFERPPRPRAKPWKRFRCTKTRFPTKMVGEFGGGRVLLRPASPGTGVIAGGGVRAVVEAAGIRDVLAKSLGSSNHANVVKATIAALRSLRRRDEILKCAEFLCSRRRKVSSMMRLA